MGKLAKCMLVRLRGTNLTAIAYRAKAGCIMVQFNDIDHPHAFGWHLYPRSAFVRARHN